MKEVAGLRLHSYFIPCLSGCLSELKSLEMKLNAETQRGPAATQTKSGLTQRHCRGTRRNAEKKNSLRISAALCTSALNLRRLRAKRDIAVQRNAEKRRENEASAILCDSLRLSASLRFTRFGKQASYFILSDLG